MPRQGRNLRIHLCFIHSWQTGVWLASQTSYWCWHLCKQKSPRSYWNSTLCKALLLLVALLCALIHNQQNCPPNSTKQNLRRCSPLRGTSPWCDRMNCASLYRKQASPRVNPYRRCVWSIWMILSRPYPKSTALSKPSHLTPLHSCRIQHLSSHYAHFWTPP